MAPTSATVCERAELERWYADELRPKLARAVRRRAVDAMQAAAFDRAMADLLGGRRAPDGRA